MIRPLRTLSAPTVSIRLGLILLGWTLTCGDRTLAQCSLPEFQKILASDASIRVEFGKAVAIDGRRALIGAWRTNDLGPDSGSVYAYEKRGDVWVEVQKIVASDGAPGDHFGAAVDLCGDRAVIGMPFDDDVGGHSGSVFFYEHDGTKWVETHKLNPRDGDNSDDYAYAVSISGDIALISSYQDDDRAPNSGAAFIYQFDGAQWNEVQKLTASDGDYNDKFSWSLSLDGSLAVVGAWNNQGRGAAYVFRFDGSRWNEEQKLTASDGRDGDKFGFASALNGEVIAVGAHLADDFGSASGATYLYRYDGQSWIEEQKLLSPDADPGAFFGHGVGLDGDALIIGAPFALIDGQPVGKSYVFRFDGQQWHADRTLRADDAAFQDQFGAAVAIDGEDTFSGARRDDDAGSGTGSVYGHSLRPLSLWIEPARVTGGDRLEMRSACGMPKTPVLLTLVKVDGNSVYQPLLLSAFDASSLWTWTQTAPPSPPMSTSLEFRTVGLTTSGEAAVSNAAPLVWH